MRTEPAPGARTEGLARRSPGTASIIRLLRVREGHMRIVPVVTGVTVVLRGGENFLPRASI